LAAANKLRYRLMPYIYSMAGSVWKDDATILRMLAFDFASDEKACNVKDQFLFGKSLMICPVTEPMYYAAESEPLTGVEKTRTVYLPAGTDWYDFYTNERYAGGQTIVAEAPIDRIPIYVKAGSIIPMAETENCPKNAAEAVSGDITAWVYSGADACFDLYEDVGDGYGYENGEDAVTHMEWKEETSSFTVYDAKSPAGWKAPEHNMILRIVE